MPEIATSRFEAAQVLDVREKLACITLDYEADYGDRTGEFNIIEDRDSLNSLAETFQRLEVPVSAFIRTDLLTDYPDSAEVLRLLATDFHCHSHSHNTKSFNSEWEIEETQKAFAKHFGSNALGYRAPLGVLYDGDVDLLQKYGFAFSSSMFPSFRPGKFNHLRMPTKPFLYSNGLMELPFAVVPRLRYIISLSYLKLLGMTANKMMMSSFGLPNPLVFDSHLHDYIVHPRSFAKLPRKLRMAWGINKNSGIKFFEIFVQMIKAKGYRLVTMSELYQHVKDQAA